MTKKEQRHQVQVQALQQLKEVLKGCKKRNGEHKLIVEVVNVSSSGMSRTLRVGVIDKNYRYRDITEIVRDITGDILTKHGYIRVSGCGMDMCFDLLYRLNYKAINLDNYKGKKKTPYNYIVSTYYHSNY